MRVSLSVTRSLPAKLTLKALITPYKPKVVAFKNLTQEQQLSIITYMCDGYWSHIFEQTEGMSLLSALPVYVREKGNIKFGTVDIPTPVIKEALTKTQNWTDITNDLKTNDVEAYFRWYRKTNGSLAKYKSNLWPVILSGDKGWLEELLQDGWHRFNAYIKRDLPVIPCIFFVQSAE